MIDWQNIMDAVDPTLKVVQTADLLRVDDTTRGTYKEFLWPYKPTPERACELIKTYFDRQRKTVIRL
jgi:hypothetical protein